jgi:NADH dehydrogenase
MNNYIPQKLSDRSRPSVVIVGANFAGLKAAVSLPEKFRVTVVDPWPWFEFSPNIHELISGYKTPDSLRFAKETVISRSGHTLIPEPVSAIHPEKQIVITHSGAQLPYDYCILALGGQSNTFNIKGADSHAMPFKSVDQCQAISERLEYLSKKKKPFSIVIAGGGFEGVEALGEILRKYKTVKDIQIHIIEKQKRMMMDAPTDIDREIRRLCTPYLVAFHTGNTVKRVWKNSVDLADQTKIPSQITIWTGGAQPPKILYESNLSTAKDQWANVNTALQHVHYPNIFAAGDAAGMLVPLSKQAYHALDMGKHAALNILRLHAGKSLKDFKPSAKPMLVSFGDLDAFLIDKRVVFAGPALGLLKEAVFQLVMTQLDPSGILLKAIHTSGRASAAAIKLAFALPLSMASLAALGRIRIVK